MKELRKSEAMVGPLKIIKLPSRSIPKFSEITPFTVKKLWEDQESENSIKKVMDEVNKDFSDQEDNKIHNEYAFHDVNPNYDQEKKVNEMTEKKVVESARKNYDSTLNDHALTT